MTELKPCPFCGNEPTIVIRKGKDGWRDRYSVLCDYEHGGCGAESGWYHYEAEAISSWNKRVSCDTCSLYSHDDGCMASLVEGEVQE